MSVNKAPHIVYITSDEDSSFEEELGKNKRSCHELNNQPLLEHLPKDEKANKKNCVFLKNFPPIEFTTSDEDSSFEEQLAKSKRARDALDDKPLLEHLPKDKKNRKRNSAFRKKVPPIIPATSDEDSLSDNDFTSYASEKRRQKEIERYAQVLNDLRSKPMEEPQVRIQFGFDIEGVKVEMPVRPYPCQKAVISAIINGCRTEQHCLLESPTGSGKTLALLCGSLAWQSDFTSKPQSRPPRWKRAGKKVRENDEAAQKRVQNLLKELSTPRRYN